MTVELRPHQIEAVAKLGNGKILCGDVGTGKSITALAYYWTKVCGGDIPLQGTGKWSPRRKNIPLVIVTTARKRDSHEWEDECSRFGLAPGDVTIDSWNNIKKYTSLDGAFVIFDEQRVVGSGSWVKSFYKIAKSNSWILLSATPGDTWRDYIPVFVANGYYKNKTQFEEMHVKWSRYAKYPKVDRYVGTKRLERLRELILVDMPYERKTVRHRQNIMVPYDQDLYRMVMKDRWNPWTKKPIKDVSELFVCIRRVVNEDYSRMTTLRELWGKHPKLIVFYNFDYELDMLRKMSSEGVVAEWNGHVHEAVPVGNRWLYLVQYTAGSEAWNCIETNAMVFWSLNYSYRIMTQCEGRIDRLNTPFVDLYYYRFRSGASIDSAIAKALNQKKSFNERSFRL